MFCVQNNTFVIQVVTVQPKGGFNKKLFKPKYHVYTHILVSLYI